MEEKEGRGWRKEGGEEGMTNRSREEEEEELFFPIHSYLCPTVCVLGGATKFISETRVEQGASRQASTQTFHWKVNNNAHVSTWTTVIKQLDLKR